MMDDGRFLRELEVASGERISSCYQCCKCTAGCPVVTEMDVYPHRIMRHVVLGDREKVLSSKAIWICLQCVTCSVRCPNEIDVAHVFDALRKIAVKEGKAADMDGWTFDGFFLRSIEKHGRLHEMETILKYKLEKGNLFGDAKMGMGMFLKGRMGVLPHNIKDRERLRDIFKRCRSQG